MVIEYADLECPYCAAAHLILKELAITRVFRHFPVDFQAPACPGARRWRREAAGAARAASGRCTTRCSRTRAISTTRTCGSARERLGLDLERFEADRRSEAAVARVEGDFRTGIAAGVMTTPTQFVAGEAHPGVPGPALLVAIGPLLALSAF